MNRFLLLFVLLISCCVLRAAPFSAGKISIEKYPVSGDFKITDTTQCTERLDLGTDIYISGSREVTLRAPGNWASYVWSNGTTTASTVVIGEGEYWLRVTDQCGNVFSDTLNVKSYPYCSFYKDNKVIGCDSTIHNLFFTACEPGFSGSYDTVSIYPVSWHFSDGSVVTGTTCSRITKKDEQLQLLVYLHNPKTGEDFRYFTTVVSAVVASVSFERILVPLDADTVVLKPPYPFSFYESSKFDPSEPLSGQWQIGDTTRDLKVTRSGQYVYTLNMSRCLKRLEFIQSYSVGDAILNPIITATAENFSYNFKDSVLTSYYPVLRWDFGDGATAEGREVTHTYAAPGEYPVRLTGINGDDQQTEYRSLNVEPPINPDLGPDALLCPGDSIYLRLQNTIVGAKYLWNTGDTTYTLKVTQPGQYILTVSEGQRTASDTINITAGCNLTAGFTYKRANDGQLTMTFTETPSHITSAITSRHWDFGDGNTAVTENPSHTYAVPGNYNVRLRIYDSIAHQQDSITQSVYIMPRIDVQLGKDTTIAAGQSLVLDAADAIGIWSGDATYYWSTGDTSRTISVNRPGLYALTVSMYGYAASDTIKVLLDPPPVESNVTMITSSTGMVPRRLAFRNTTSLPRILETTWYTGDGSTVSTGNDTTSYFFHTYAQEGVYQVRMEVLTTDNVIHTAVKEIRIWPEFNAGNDTTYTGSPMLFKINEPFYSDSATECTWYPGGIKARELLVTKPDTYYAYVTNNGFNSADTFHVKDGRPQAHADFSYTRANDGQYTMNFSAIPTAGVDTATYTWSLGDTTTATGAHTSHTYASPGVYTVTLFVKDTLQREDTIRRFISIVPFVSVNLGADTTVEQGTSLRLDGITAIGGIRPDDVHFSWSTGDTSSAITVTQPGNYALSVSMYGRTVTDSIHVYHHVTPPLKAAFTYSRANDGRLTVNFEAAPTPRAVKYEWNFGDNSYSDTGRVVSHTYTRVASFRVVLTVSDSLNAKDSTQQNIIIVAPIRIDLGPDTTYYGTPLSIRINAPYYGDSTVTCSWWPGNLNGQSITVNAPGTYYATATQYGYRFTDTIVVREGRPQQPADFSAIRANDGAYTMNFTGMPASNMTGRMAYTWNFGDGYTANGKEVSHTYANPGLYSVYLSISDSLQHIDTVRRLVNVIDFVSVRLGPDTTLVPGGSIFLDGIAAIGGTRPDDVRFLWSTGDTTWFIKVTQAGTYTLSVSMYGNTRRDTIVVTEASPAAVAFHNNAASADRLTQHFYNDSRQGRYPIEKSTWTFDSVTVITMGAPDSTLPVPHRFPAYGWHTVMLVVQDNNGYVSTLTKNILLQADTTTPVPPVIDSSAAVVTVTDSIPLTYTFPHEFSPENVFTVQLIQSDVVPGGRSTAPEIINLNSFPGTDSRVSLNVKLPETVPCGRNYRIRIVSSAPADSSLWSQGFEVSNPPAVPLLAQRGDSLESTAAYAYQWFRNGQPVNGATTRAIRAKVNGSYQVQVFSSGDCSTMSAPLSMVITGLTDISLTVSQLKVYPNPAAGAVYVEVDKVPEKPVQADVYNSRGAIVHTLLITEKKTVLDLSAQPKGIYYILPRGAGKQKAATVVIQ